MNAYNCNDRSGNNFGEKGCIFFKDVVLRAFDVFCGIMYDSNYLNRLCECVYFQKKLFAAYFCTLLNMSVKDLIHTLSL